MDKRISGVFAIKWANSETIYYVLKTNRPDKKPFAVIWKTFSKIVSVQYDLKTLKARSTYIDKSDKRYIIPKEIREYVNNNYEL